MSDKGYAPGWCVHYRSILTHERCGAGFSLDKYQGNGLNRWPCFSTSINPLPCPKRRLPTEDEIAAYHKRRKGRTEKMLVAMKNLEPLRANWQKTHQGSTVRIDCPECGKKNGLAIGIASSNGHSRGQCLTKGCLQWVE